MSGEEVTDEKERLEEEVENLEGKIKNFKRKNKDDPTFDPLLRELLKKSRRELNEITDAHGQSHEYGHLHPNVAKTTLNLRKSQKALKDVKKRQKTQMLAFREPPHNNIYDPYYGLTGR